MSTASQIPAGAMYGVAQYVDYKSKTKLHNVQVLLSSYEKESGGVKGVMQWVGKDETMQRVHGFKQLCSSVRATPLYILKWVLCRLYKKSGSGEMRFDGVIVIGYNQEW